MLKFTATIHSKATDLVLPGPLYMNPVVVMSRAALKVDGEETLACKRGKKDK